MNCRYIMMFATFVAIATECSIGQTAFTWNGGTSSAWNLAENWDPSDMGYPGDDSGDDTVSIFSEIRQPTIPDDLTITISRLTMVKDDTQSPILTLDDGDQFLTRLVVTEKDGVNIGAGCQVHLEKSTALLLYGDVPDDGDDDGQTSTITLQGDIIFKSTENNKVPYIAFGPEEDNYSQHKTFLITGSGMIFGEAKGFLNANSASSAATKTVVVLGPGNKIHGDVEIGVTLINNGLVDPLDPRAEPASGRKIVLRCAPMSGFGKWHITGGTSANSRNELEVLATLTGTGELHVGEWGLLDVQRHVSFYGDFEMAENGKIAVAQRIILDVNRWAKTCDYQGS